MTNTIEYKTGSVAEGATAVGTELQENVSIPAKQPSRLAECFIAAASCLICWRLISVLTELLYNEYNEDNNQE